MTQLFWETQKLHCHFSRKTYRVETHFEWSYVAFRLEFNQLLNTSSLLQEVNCACVSLSNWGKASVKNMASIRVTISILFLSCINEYEPKLTSQNTDVYMSRFSKQSKWKHCKVQLKTLETGFADMVSVQQLQRFPSLVKANLTQLYWRIKRSFYRRIYVSFTNEFSAVYRQI